MPRKPNRFGEARCGYCGRTIGLMKSGHLRHHLRQRGGDGIVCHGTWCLPQDTMESDLTLVGQIQVICDHDSTMPSSYQIRGHVAKAKFARALAYSHAMIADLDVIHHEYVRLMPLFYQETRCMTYVKADGPGRGAFPVTVAYYDDCEPI